MKSDKKKRKELDILFWLCVILAGINIFFGIVFEKILILLLGVYFWIGTIIGTILGMYD